MLGNANLSNKNMNMKSNERAIMSESHAQLSCSNAKNDEKRNDAFVLKLATFRARTAPTTSTRSRWVRAGRCVDSIYHGAYGLPIRNDNEFFGSHFLHGLHHRIIRGKGTGHRRAHSLLSPFSFLSATLIMFAKVLSRLLAKMRYIKAK